MNDCFLSICQSLQHARCSNASDTRVYTDDLFSEHDDVSAMQRIMLFDAMMILHGHLKKKILVRRYMGLKVMLILRNAIQSHLAREDRGANHASRQAKHVKEDDNNFEVM